MFWSQASLLVLGRQRTGFISWSKPMIHSSQPLSFPRLVYPPRRMWESTRVQWHFTLSHRWPPATKILSNIV
ncbi:hypothetical protein MGG_17121 [Pyricularia oryzae 70-15]|uniref:Uncharacterized protein n=1 Tax=Pyricularia oryzae (strain 70-15 / ATCC MYA-4617 / FGSC 8958) TaxID=242507 RepID=G4N9H2_PYRO7|nr:uncharacterized protein MGG_17121 [Pyricularia oryzae 70-15]EHA50364.1 hypothetical protein MGG_17121 [Pyricularia oryzae 70-15]